MATSTLGELSEHATLPTVGLARNASGWLTSALFVAGLLAVVYYRSRRSSSSKKEKFVMPSEADIAKLINDFHPEPLAAAPVDPEHYALNPHVVQGKMGHYVKIDGREYLNLATMNFLGLVGDSRIEQVAKETIKKYGVGSCGPRGFYGTVDVHLDLEKQIADFMHCEESALYSYGFATITSAIPAYAKRGDVIFADKAVNFAIQKGIYASRAKVYWFEHNDVQHLEQLLNEQEKWDKKNVAKSKTVRRFIIVEGVYLNTGAICPLPDLIRLKMAHRARIFVDESVSFGVLGATGRGVIEHYNVQVDDVDMVMATMEMAVASTGGFCVGRSFVIEHHRLSGLGYCFSASLPPLLATAAGEALNIINSEPERVARLQSNSATVRHRLEQAVQGTEFVLDKAGYEHSPIIHIRHTRHDEAALDALVQHAFDNGVLLTRARYLPEFEVFDVKPSIRLSVNSELTGEEVEKIVDVIRQHLQQ